MATWGIWGPVREYALDRPTPQLYYVHHPWGTYWVIGELTKLLGRHTFVPRLEPVILCVACPPLLYGIGRALWGPVPGALAALAYAVLPIVLAFGNFPGFEGPLIFGCLLTTWGYVRFQQRWRRRWMAVSLAGMLWSINCDWEAGLFAGAVLGTLLVTSYFMPRWFGAVDARRFGQWWALSFCIVVLTVLAYLALREAHRRGRRVPEPGSQAREGQRPAPLCQVLAGRRYWIDVSFTPIAIVVGKIAAPIFLFRFLFLRRPAEIFPLAILLMATLRVRPLQERRGRAHLLAAPVRALLGAVARRSRQDGARSHRAPGRAPRRHSAVSHEGRDRARGPRRDRPLAAARSCPTASGASTMPGRPGAASTTAGGASSRTWTSRRPPRGSAGRWRGRRACRSTRACTRRGRSTGPSGAPRSASTGRPRDRPAARTGTS